MHKSFGSRIYVYVSCDNQPTEGARLVSLANANGTNIGGGFVESPAQVSDCLTALGCPQDRLPERDYSDSFVRVMTNVRPRELESALALLD